MPYRIRQFDGLLLPELVNRNAQANDMGTGEALTSFTQLPGGGFFDNYGAADSPQGIRPIIRNCLLMGDTAQDRVNTLKALRGKIGRRGKLTVEFDTGELWWQWARLKRLSIPRGEQDKAVSPIGFMWETAAQVWYGLVQTSDTWSVGDDSFYLGDGTTGLGMNDYLFEFDAATDTLNTTLPNEGNTYARNLYMELATDAAMVAFQISSETTGHLLSFTNPGLTGRFTVMIDTGAKSCLVRHEDASVAIDSAIGRGPYVSVGTSSAHGLVDHDSVELAGTTYFDGIYHDVEVTSITSFEAPMPAGRFSGGESVVAGTAYPVLSGWSTLAASDRANWFLLAEGDNEVSFFHGVSGTPTRDYTLKMRWYDHYR